MNTTSSRMLKAIELVRAGHTAYKAAKTAGITPQALYQSELYRTALADREASSTALRKANRLST